MSVNVNTFPKQSIDGGRYQYGTKCAGHMTFHKWQGTDSISTLQLYNL